MSGNNAKVLLDLNFPEFQEEFFDLDVSELKKVTKTFKKITKLTWNEVFKDKGLRWETIISRPGNYSIRLSESYRAVVERSDCFMRFKALHEDHDGAYGKK